MPGSSPIRRNAQAESKPSTSGHQTFIVTDKPAATKYVIASSSAPVWRLRHQVNTNAAASTANIAANT